MRPEILLQEKWRKERWAFVKMVAIVACLQATGSLLRTCLGVPRPLAFAISDTIVFLPAYWVPPRSEIAFLRYATMIAAFVATGVIELSAPDILRRHMPIQLAVSLPLLIVCLPLYYLFLKLAPDTLRKIGLVKWAVASLVIAMILAGVATIGPSGI